MTASGEPIPLLRTFTLLGGTLGYTCTDQETCQWIVKDLNNEEETLLLSH